MTGCWAVLAATHCVVVTLDLIAVRKTQCTCLIQVWTCGPDVRVDHPAAQLLADQQPRLCHAPEDVK